MSNRSYPIDLLSWAGDKKHGVKKPFDRNSGRPLGEKIQLETALVRKINQWSSELVNSPNEVNLPRHVFLVGGPGNGKTDVVEHCVDQFDRELGAAGSLMQQFRDLFETTDGSLPPRRSEVSSGSYSSKSERKFDFWIVQDATEGDANGASAEEALLNDLVQITNSSHNLIYICCVNRGIISELTNLDKSDEIKNLLDEIIQVSTVGNNTSHCWPLKNYNNVAVWPMDEESLVTPLGAEEKSVAHKIFEAALEKEYWKDTCSAGEFCPFCTNQKYLSDTKNLDGLIKILKNYEQLTGRRWTFRDLFSLVPYLLLGEETKFLNPDGERTDPCQWAANKYEEYKNSTDKIANLHELVGRLYYHRLFSNWPNLRSGKHKLAYDKLLSKKKLEGVLELNDRQLTRQHYSYLRSHNNLSANPVHFRISNDEFKVLDPANIAPTELIYDGVDGAEFDNRFSISVATGLDYFKTQLSDLEIELLSVLSRSDADLIASNIDKSDINHSELLQNSIRKFSVVLVKRSICVRKGMCSKASLFESYASLASNRDSQKRIREQFKKLLNRDERFHVALATTFGQPVTNRSRDITLKMPKINVQFELADTADKSRPGEKMAELSVSGSGIKIPLTFQLYESIFSIADGMLEASLPEEIYAMIDSVKSKVGGVVVRKPEYLEDGFDLLLGPQKASVEIFNDEIDVSWKDFQ